MQGEWSTPEGDLRALVHHGKALPGAGNFFSGRTKEYPAFHGPQQSVELSHAPKLGVHISKFSHRTVCDSFAPWLARILIQCPSLLPSVEGERVVSGVVVFESEAGQQRRSPRGGRMPLQKVGQARKVVGAGAFSIA